VLAVSAVAVRQGIQTPGYRLALAGFAIVAGTGCSDDSAQTEPPGDALPADPLAAVSQAGAGTFAEPTLSLDLEVASRGARYEASGLIEPGEGRFRVELGEIFSPSDYRPRIVIGLDGEGYESTVEETTGGPFGDGGERCWFNPHAPVGSFLGTASVEESVRLTGAVLESLSEEVRSATSTADNAYEVALDPSAARPRDDFRESKERVWGDRNLLGQLAGPIETALSAQGAVARIALELRDYEVPRGLIRPRRGRIGRVTIEATLAPTDEELVLDAPECQALE
jgi:hypothetical protein